MLVNAFTFTSIMAHKSSKASSGGCFPADPAETAETGQVSEARGGTAPH